MAALWDFGALSVQIGVWEFFEVENADRARNTILNTYSLLFASCSGTMDAVLPTT